MKIASTDLCMNNNAYFKARKPIIARQGMKEIEEKSLEGVAALSAATVAMLKINKETDDKSLDKSLKYQGINYIKSSDDVITISGPHTGYFKINKSENIKKHEKASNAKQLILSELMDDDKLCFLGGLKNYKACIDDLGRQDIVEKGLGIADDVINTEINNVTQLRVAKIFAKKLNNCYVEPHNIFYIGESAYYYDKNHKTIYTIAMNNNNVISDICLMYECKFELGKNGKAIGYNRTEWNISQDKIINTAYKEQQLPSKELPKYTTLSYNKILAECCRFGNGDLSDIDNEVVNNVLTHLKNHRFNNATTYDLQVLKYKDSKGLKQHRVLYFNPETGSSLLYNKDGKCINQIQYHRDNDGNIVGCTNMY